MSSSTALGQAEPGHEASSALHPFHPVSDIQPHGLLLVVREPVLRVVQASANAGAMLQRPLDSVLLATLRDLGGDIEWRLRELLAAGPVSEPQPLRCTIADGSASPPAYEGAVHRIGSDTLVLELEPRAEAGGAELVDMPAPDLLHRLRSAVERISVSPTLPTLAACMAEEVRALLGYERVLVYRFDAAGRAQVLAQLGNELPGALPQTAAELYDSGAEAPAGVQPLMLQQRVRVLVDVRRTRVEMVPRLAPDAGQHSELAQSYLRNTSAAHAMHLQLLGLPAALAISVMREGRLWGLITCHHAVPRNLRYRLRAACELLAEVMTTRIAALESQARARVADLAHRLETRLVQAAASEGGWREALFRDAGLLLQPLRAGSALLQHEGRLYTCGEAPTPPELKRLLLWLASQRGESPLHSHSLRRDHALLASLPAQAAGLLAVRLAGAGAEYMVWLRAADGQRQGDAEPWTADEVALACAYAQAMSDLVVQVDAVRMLIAQSHLTRLRHGVDESPDAVVVVDTAPHGFHANPAFHALAGLARGACTSLDMLIRLFSDPVLAHQVVGQVRAEQRAWRGELALLRQDDTPLPVAVRAEPVPGQDGSLLGLIFIFQDLSAAKRASAARQRLEAALSQASRQPAATAGGGLAGAIITNAGLAAADSDESGLLPSIAPLLEEVEASTARATLLLERLRSEPGPRA